VCASPDYRRGNIMMRKQLWILLAVLALALPLAAVQAQGTIAATGSVTGELNNNTVQYAMSLNAGQTVSITLASDAFDAYLRLKDSTGATLAEDDDSGGNLNSALVFSASAAGTYQIEVGSFGGTATGAFTLTTAETVIQALAYGGSAKLLLDGSGTVTYFTFSGNEGDVVTVYTDNPDVDMRLNLYDAAGNEIAYDDDSGPGSAALIRNFMLPATQSYRLAVAPYSTDTTGVAKVFLEQSTLPMLDAGVQTVTFSDEFSTERLGFNASDNMRYRITVTTSAPSNGNLEVALDPEDYETTSVSYNNVLEFTAVFEATNTGLVIVTINDYSWVENSTTYQLSVAPVQ
jgi:hypothetical protein